jgi:hypothetical protein
MRMTPWGMMKDDTKLDEDVRPIPQVGLKGGGRRGDTCPSHPARTMRRKIEGECAVHQPLAKLGTELGPVDRLPEQRDRDVTEWALAPTPPTTMVTLFIEDHVMYAGHTHCMCMKMCWMRTHTFSMQKIVEIRI